MDIDADIGMDVNDNACRDANMNAGVYLYRL